MLPLRHTNPANHIFIVVVHAVKQDMRTCKREYAMPIPAHPECMDNFVPLTPTHVWVFHHQDSNLQPPADRVHTFLLCHSSAICFIIKAKLKSSHIRWNGSAIASIPASQLEGSPVSEWVSSGFSFFLPPPNTCL